MLRAAEELGDPLTLAQAWNLLGRFEGTIIGSLARAEEAWQQALAHAERANLPTERAESIGWLMMAANFGPLPVEEGIARCRRFYDEAVDDPFIRGQRLASSSARCRRCSATSRTGGSSSPRGWRRSPASASRCARR